MSKLFLGIILTLCVYLPGAAQDEGEGYREFGVAVGGSVYQGDLSPYRLGTLSKPGLSVQLFSNWRLNSAFSFRFNYAFAFLQESDRNYPVGYKSHRNFSFETKANEFSAHLVFNPLNNNTYEELNRVMPYVFGGAGISLLSISRDFKDFDYGWKAWQKWVVPGVLADSAHALPKYAFVFPVGVGFRYFFEENLSLFAEVTQRFTREEYLDGFSKGANQKKRDAYTTYTVGLVFRRPSGYYSRKRYY